MKWNDAQLSAIMTRGKNILVSAAAGSGKTAVLTERIKRLITDEGVGIDEMLIVTFTNAAAGEMRERIYKGIAEAMEDEGANVPFLQEQLDRIGTADISTFHAFCLKVIRDYFYLTDLEPDFKICDEAQSEIFAQESMETLINEFFEAENNEEFLKFIRKYSKAGNEKGISDMVKAVYSFIKSLPDPFGWLEKSVEMLGESEDETEKLTYPSACVLRDMVVRYDEIFMKKKLSINQIDFNDIEHMALKILQNPEPCSEYRERFKHIFIDEYQDTNSVQEELISRIKRENNLFMVGDVKQSIYQFRLADPQIFIDKYKKFRTGEDENSIKIDLNCNFRSKPPVLEGTNVVMKKIMTGEASGISYDEDAMLYPGFNYFSTEAGEYSKEPVEVDLLVESDLKEGLRSIAEDVSDIKSAEIEAMFVCSRIKEILGKKYYDSKENRLKTVTYDDIVILMRSYRGTAQIYQEVFRREEIPAYIEGNDGYFETVEISIFVNLLRLILNIRQDIPLLSVLHSMIFEFSAEELSKIRIHQPKGLFSEAFLAYCDEGEDEKLRKKCVYAFDRISRWKDASHYISLKDLMWKLAEESGFYDFICGLPLGSHRARNLKALIDRSEKYQKNTAQGLVGFVRYLEQLELNAAPLTGQKPGGESESFVRLMSIHKSKGLEFPVVIVAGLGKSFNHRKPSGELSMEKNLGLGLRFRSENNDYYMKTARQLAIDEAVKEKELAEEMRILYVAMTRAKEKLILTGSVKKLDSDELPGQGKDAMECTSFMEWLCSLDYESATSDKKLSLESDEYEIINLNVFREVSWEAGEKSENTEASSSESKKEEKNEDKEADKKDFVYKYAEATKIPGKFTATELNRINKRGIVERISEFEEPIVYSDSIKISAPQLKTAFPEKKLSTDGLTAAEKGTITHRVLQEIDILRTDDIKEISLQLEEMESQGKLSEREKKGVRADWILRFFGSELGRRLRLAEKAGKLSREKPFLLWEAHDEETGSIVQGVIDCFFEENGKIILLDYKTDYISKKNEEGELKEKAEGYRTQLEIYKRAIEESTGKTVGEAYLYFLSVGRAVRLQ